MAKVDIQRFALKELKSYMYIYCIFVTKRGGSHHYDEETKKKIIHLCILDVQCFEWHLAMRYSTLKINEFMPISPWKLPV
jgi:hypothetical protein